MQQAVRAYQLMRAIKARDIELLYGLPDWAITATMEHQVFMTDDDDYTGLWVTFPMETDQISIMVVGVPEGYQPDSIAFRFQPNDILVYRGDGIISVLTTPKGART